MKTTMALVTGSKHSIVTYQCLILLPYPLGTQPLDLSGLQIFHTKCKHTIRQTK